MAKSRKEVLADLQLARRGGGRANQWKQAEDASIYDEVSEDKYHKIVRDRLLRDDFVEDDGVDGYADNGMDFLGEPTAESEEERDVKAKRGKPSKSKTKPKPVIPDPAPMSAYRPVVSESKESEFMDSLLSGMNSAPAPKRNPRKRKSSPDDDLDHDLFNFRDNKSVSSDAPDEFDFPPFGSKLRRGALSSDDEDTYNAPTKRFKNAEGVGIHVTPATVKIENLQVNDPYDFDQEFDPIGDDYIMDDVKKEESPIALSKLRQKPVKAAASKKEEPDEPPSWLTMYATLKAVSDDAVGGGANNLVSTRVQALEDDDTLRMFWIDYLEIDGKIYLVGKVLDKATNKYVSACVTVNNIERNLFVLPRERYLEDGYETDIVPDQMDVYRDFDQARQHYKIGRFGAKWVQRNYAFGEPDVPTTSTAWMKVVYPFSDPAMPRDISSPNIARIFGTNTTAFELFVLKRKIMGPCWLQIKNIEISNKGVSWCKLEASVSNPKDVIALPESAMKIMPPLTIMSLSVKTVVNHTENKREIVCIASRIWEDNQIEDTTPLEKLACIAHTFVRPLEKFPKEFESVAKRSKQSKIQPLANERMLLSNLLVLIQRYDPDVIVGHDFLGVSLDIILYRMRELKADHWSRISRFKRKTWPNIGRQGTNLKFLNGRLLCDLASDGAKGMIASTTWSLTEMVQSQLKVSRQDIDPDDTALYFDYEMSSPERLMEFVQHSDLDAYFQMAIALKVQILPLTRQLTNLAGNSWNKTLNGGRAERNEYILLHEFHSLKYICPDKTWGKKAATAVKLEAEEGDGAVVPTKGKKDKYKGGLVFEPKRGLWDKIILVMDFNSLYPSIIQEYNIDFTTIARAETAPDEEEKIPDVPPSDIPQGVLPRLIAGLVNRRKRVKALMKDQNSTPAQRMQWDIKQQALKLTANSMYGCLGFEYSRFYARPLAALTTFKGREILTQTRELAESMNLDVVYGDTDSVFVNSNHLELSEALKLAHQFKKAVNERYRLLEIDVDGVFQRLLLLQKKKYAAIKIENNKPTMEVKGLDMKRREYSALSKNASKEVLEHILSGEEAEVVVEKIHEYLGSIAEQVRNGSINSEDFIIFKRLSKNPQDYPDAKSQPHVQVALRMQSKGQSAKAGDVIPYIFCLGEDGSSSKTAQADRARHPEEIKRSNGELKIDFEHYLAQQVLPPIERLCDPIEGTDRARLAECLGLDPSRYQSNNVGGGEEKMFSTLGSQLSDRERFKDCTPFLVQCRKCGSSKPFVSLLQPDNEIVTSSGVVCAVESCQAPILDASLQAQLEVQIRGFISRYYQGWMVCDDSVCAKRTRMMRVYGKRCLTQDCKGTMSFEYTDTQLYNQLLYFSSLFDANKLINTAKGTSKQDFVTSLVGSNSETLRVLTLVSDKYLNQCGRRWVDLKDLFSFMTIDRKPPAEAN